MEFKLERFEQKYFREVYDLHVRALKSINAYAGEGPWDYDLYDIDKYYLHGRGDFIIGFLDGKLVAMGALKRIDDSTAEITRMRVSPDHQGKGYGTTILMRLIGRAKELGYRKLVLETSELQLPAQKLYTRFGFKEFQRGILKGFKVIYYQKEI